MRRRPTGRLVGLPPLLWLGFFFVLPLLVTLRISLSESALAQPPYRPVFGWELTGSQWWDRIRQLSFDNFVAVAGDELYVRAALFSFGMAAAATILIAAVALPVALALARSPKIWRPLLVALIVVPFWTSFLVRVYAWIALIGPSGLLNATLLRAGLIAQPLRLLDGNGAVLAGLVYAYLPFMILPLYAALDRQDPALAEAAADLGASRLVAFWTVILPVAMPGLVAGSLLCFIPIVGEFVVPDLLGGPDTLMLGRVVWAEFFANRDWPLAAALAIVLLLVLSVPIGLFRRIEAARVEARR